MHAYKLLYGHTAQGTTIRRARQCGGDDRGCRRTKWGGGGYKCGGYTSPPCLNVTAYGIRCSGLCASETSGAIARGRELAGQPRISHVHTRTNIIHQQDVIIDIHVYEYILNASLHMQRVYSRTYMLYICYMHTLYFVKMQFIDNNVLLPDTRLSSSKSYGMLHLHTYIYIYNCPHILHAAARHTYC